MKRKINRVGQNTLTVSLPSGWVKKHNLKKGDEIDLIEEHDSVRILKGEHKQLKKEYKLVLNSNEMISYNDDVDGFNRYFHTHLTNLYIHGYDKIFVEFPSNKLVHELKSFVKNQMLGYEITEFKNNRCTIENISNPDEDKFETILRRLFLMTKKIMEDLYNDLKNNTLETASFYKDQAACIESYSNYCLRMILNSHSKGSYALWSIVLQLTQIYKTIEYVYCNFPKCKPKLKYPKDTMNLMKEIIALLEMDYQLFYKFDANLAKKIHDRYVQTKYLNTVLSKKNDELFLDYHLGKTIRYTLYLAQFTILYHTTPGD